MLPRTVLTATEGETGCSWNPTNILKEIWSVARDKEGWRPMEDRGSTSANHIDHVHISFNPLSDTVTAVVDAADTMSSLLSGSCPEIAPGSDNPAISAAGLAPGKDDYLAWWKQTAGGSDGLDPQQFYWGECVSYASFAVRTYTSHKDFTNYWQARHFGNANRWANEARAVGIPGSSQKAVDEGPESADVE